MTQYDLILEYVRKNGSITQMEAYNAFGCARLAARIAVLEDRGYNFLHEMITEKNRYGKKVSYTRYSLLGEVKNERQCGVISEYVCEPESPSC